MRIGHDCIHKSDVESIPSCPTFHLLFPQEQLRCSLVKEWSKAVVWEENADEDCRYLRLHLSPEDLQRLLLALATVQEVRRCVRVTVDRFVQRLLLPFARGERDLLCSPEPPAGLVFVSRLPAIQRALSPSELFPRLKEVLRAANDALLSLQMGEGIGRVVDLVRSGADEALITALIDNCVARSLPACQEELRPFADDLQPRCAALEQQLRAWGVVDPSSRRLSSYVQEIDALFLEKKKESLLVRARDLMRLQLFEIAKVSDGPSANLIQTLRKSFRLFHVCSSTLTNARVHPC